MIIEVGGSQLAGENKKGAGGLATIQIKVDPGEIEDFRDLAGDDHFERSIIDAATAHVEIAFRKALGDRLLAFRLTSPGRVGWQKKWLDNHKKTVRTALDQGVVRVTWIRPVIDVPHDEPETFEFLQDPDVMRLPGAAKIEQANPVAELSIKVKAMKKWKRLTFSHLGVTLPVSGFPWAGVDPRACTCPEHAIIPHLYGIVPTYVCGICGRRSWCGCMSDVVEILRTRENYNTQPILDLIKSADGPRDKACHLCRGVPVTSTPDYGEKGLKGLMLQYRPYHHMAAIANGWDWKEAENSVRERLSIPRIGEGWIGEAMLLKRVRALFPDEEIVHQGSPDWLGRQRFDIWMPGRKVAIEYNGEQHYSAVSAFGGDEAFERTKIRDELKRKLCLDNDAALIEIPYYRPLEDSELKSLVLAMTRP